MNVDNKKPNQFDFEFPLRNSYMPMMMSLTENVCRKEVRDILNTEKEN